MPQAGNPQSLNRYTYVRNRPLNYIDPSGHKECEKSTDVGTCQGATNRERAWADLSNEVLAYCAQSGGCDSGLGEFLKDAASLNDVADAAITAEKCARGQCDGWDVIGAAAPILSGRLLRKGVEFVGDILKKIFGKADDALLAVTRSSAAQIANGHAYQKHVIEKAEFPWISDRQAFSQFLEGIMANPKTPVKNLSNSRTAWWDDATGTVIIRDPLAVDGGTAFRPLDGRKYFDNLK